MIISDWWRFSFSSPFSQDRMLQAIFVCGFGCALSLDTQSCIKRLLVVLDSTFWVHTWPERILRSKSSKWCTLHCILPHWFENVIIENIHWAHSLVTSMPFEILSKTKMMKIIYRKVIKTRWFWNFGLSDLEYDLCSGLLWDALIRFLLHSSIVKSDKEVFPVLRYGISQTLP